MFDWRQVGVAGVSLLALSIPVNAQEAATEEAFAGEDIVVTARRRDESLQDVPLTVNAVTSATIEKLNIRDLKDITAVVPGLVLAPGTRTTGSVSSLRGLNVDNTSSGNNGTVEFYLNDAPVSAGGVLQSLYDIGQIEVLRGPQGTLRGRASPSGSITVTTKRPVMDEWGGYAQGTATSLGGLNLQGAINVPIIKDVLAVRVAGLFENNEGSRVKSVNSLGWEPSNKTRAFRVSARFTPTDSLELNGTYSHLVKNSIVWDQVESANIADPTAPASPRLIGARDRLAVENVPNVNHQAFDIFNWQARWSFAGQRLSYVGNYVKQDLFSFEPTDKGDLFDASFPGDASLPNNDFSYSTFAPGLNLQNYGQASHSYTRQESHELRLSSDERLFGMVNYIIGGFINRTQPSTDSVSASRVNFTPSLAPANFTGFTRQQTVRRGRTLEKAVFGNLTVHLGEATEIAGGIRYLNYQENLNGANNSFGATIWTASIKHKFTPDLMAYASAGTSFRVGSGTNALILARNINVAGIRDPFLLSLVPITPERSKSYEIGLRSSWLDRKLMVNLSAFYQTFDNYIFPVSPFYVINNPTGADPVPVSDANVVLTIASLAAPVPAKVHGIEAEIAFRPSSNLSFSASLAYAKAKMSNAVVPCTPPGASTPATAAQIGLAPNQQVGRCNVNQSAGRAAPFSGSFQGEFQQPVNDRMNGFLRGLVQVYGNSENDPQNRFDDVPAYALLNLYAGVRAEDGSWEVSAYGKNLFNTLRVTDRASTPAGVASNLGTLNSTYRVIGTTEPREFGITAKISFGSR